MRLTESALPTELMLQTESRNMAVLCARSAMAVKPCFDAALEPFTGDLMLVDEEGNIAGAITPEFFGLFAEEC